MKHIKLFSAFLLAFYSSTVVAQSAEMADTMRSEGKIYVVISIMLVIFIGLIIYLFSIDRKISRLEKKVMDKTSDS